MNFKKRQPSDITRSHQPKSRLQRVWKTALVIGLILAAGLGWVVIRDEPDEPPATWLVSFVQFIEDQLQPSVDLVEETEIKQKRYAELLIELDDTVNSKEMTILQESGRSRVGERIELSIELASKSFDEGDIDNALRLLHNARLEWDETIAGFEIDSLGLHSDSENASVSEVPATTLDSEVAAVSTSNEISEEDVPAIADSVEARDPELALQEPPQPIYSDESESIIESADKKQEPAGSVSKEISQANQLDASNEEKSVAIDQNQTISTQAVPATSSNGFESPNEVNSTTNATDLNLSDSIGSGNEIEVASEKTPEAHTAAEEQTSPLAVARGTSNASQDPVSTSNSVSENVGAKDAAKADSSVLSSEPSSSVEKNNNVNDTAIISGTSRVAEGSHSSDNSTPIDERVDIGALIDDQQQIAMIDPTLKDPVEPLPSDSVDKLEESSPVDESILEQNRAQGRYLELAEEVDKLIESISHNKNLPEELAEQLARTIQSRKIAAEAYDEFDYLSAERSIEFALSVINELIQREDRQFQVAMQTARDAYRLEDVTLAAEAIESAYKLRPNDSEVEHWRNKISELPKLRAARQNALDARYASDVKSEIAALEQVLFYRPNDADSERRIVELRQKLADEQFNLTVSKVIQAIDSRNLKAAKSALTAVKKQRPSDASIANLQIQIENLERQLTIEHYLDSAEDAILNDYWIAASKSFENVLAIDSTHSEAHQGLLFAMNIVDAQQRVDYFLDRPDRLSSSNIEAAAQETIEEVQLYTAFSQKLSTSIDSLYAALTEWTASIPIRVLSDGKTDIGIRGVGKIGKTKERTVQLRPGNYVFEGKRKGYHSILVEFVVASNPNQTQEVTVICSERN